MWLSDDLVQVNYCYHWFPLDVYKWANPFVVKKNKTSKAIKVMVRLLTSHKLPQASAPCVRCSAYRINYKTCYLTVSVQEESFPWELFDLGTRY